MGSRPLTDLHVFEEESALATVVAHVQEPPIPPSQRTELEIPGALERIVLQRLEKDPADRPQSAAGLADRLAACDTDGEWSAEQARDCWSLHMPESEFAPLDAADVDPARSPTLTVRR